MTIYIISGFMRSGTSCMMKALEAGGLKTVYNADRDKMNDQFGDDDYKVNGGGFYELNRAEYQHPDFPNNCDEKLVKCLWGGMLRLKASPIMKRIIFMRRPIDEIAKSYEAAFGNPHPATIPELKKKLDMVVGILHMRRDVEVIEVDYHDVLNEPLGVFKRIAKAGWPIDAKKAAQIVDPTLYRHRAA